MSRWNPERGKGVRRMVQSEYELLFCEKCGEHQTGRNGSLCACGNWLYYYQMVKRQAVLKDGR